MKTEADESLEKNYSTMRSARTGEELWDRFVGGVTEDFEKVQADKVVHDKLDQVGSDQMAEKDESEAKRAECGGESDPINMEHYQAGEAGGGAPESPSSEHWDKVVSGHVGGSEE
eukprot:7000957-Alexandrium_andersonii.AAC.1